LNKRRIILLKRLSVHCGAIRALHSSRSDLVSHLQQ
jgi:hypothetical protein